MPSELHSQENPSPQAEPLGPDALQALSKQVSELSEYLSVYLNAHLERLKLEVKETAWNLAFIPVAVLFLSAAIFISMAFLFYGAAEGLKEIFGDQPYLAYLAVGGFLLIVVAGAIWYFLVGQRKKSFHKRIKDYEKELENQQVRFGRNMAEQAARQARE